MRRLEAHPYRLATIATAVLGGVLLGHALDSSVTAYTLLTGAAGAIAGLAAAVMATRDSFDARLTAALVCAVTGFVALLAMILGLPGRGDGDITLTGATLVACGILVPVLLAIHHSSALVGDGRARPYAR